MRLVITGLGYFSKIGNTKEKLDEALNDTVIVPEEYSKISDEKLKSKCAYEIEGHMDPADFLENRKLKRLAKFSQTLCCVAKAAIEDSGIRDENHPIADERFGTIVTTTHGPLQVTFDYLTDLINEGPAFARPFLFQQTVNNVACGQVAIENKLKGVSSTIVGASSVQYAISLLRKGVADAVMVAGQEELHPYIYASYEKKGLLSTDEGKGDKSIPFAKEANGLVLGEGAGAIVLETYDNAVKRNAHIYAEVIDEAVVTDEQYINSYDEFDADKSTGLVRAMNGVLTKSGVDKKDIGFISLAANSYKKFDDVEKAAVKKVFEGRDDLGYLATKAIFGETIGASELLAIIPALRCMEHKKVYGLQYCGADNHATDNTEYCLVNSVFPGGNINSLLLKNINK